MKKYVEGCRGGGPRGVGLLHTSQHVKLFHSLIFAGSLESANCWLVRVS